jgi:predicted nucleic acid-binding protein
LENDSVIGSYDKLIISDNTCINWLQKYDKINLLKYLFNNVVVTSDVKKEYENIKGRKLPEWINVFNPEDNLFVEKLRLQLKGKGESSSIALANENKHNSLLIIDEGEGRNIALSMNLNVIRTGAIIVLGYDKDYFKNSQEPKELIDNMVSGGFRIDEDSVKILKNKIDMIERNKNTSQ